MTNYVGTKWDSTMLGFYKDFTQKEQKDTELSSIFFNLKKMLEKKSSYHWHIHSFQQFTKNNMNPFSLRIQIFPTLENMSTSFKNDWEKNLSTCSAGMMSLLTDEYKRKLREVNKD